MTPASHEVTFRGEAVDCTPGRVRAARACWSPSPAGSSPATSCSGTCTAPSDLRLPPHGRRARRQPAQEARPGADPHRLRRGLRASRAAGRGASSRPAVPARRRDRAGRRRRRDVGDRQRHDRRRPGGAAAVAARRRAGLRRAGRLRRHARLLGRRAGAGRPAGPPAGRRGHGHRHDRAGAGRLRRAARDAARPAQARARIDPLDVDTALLATAESPQTEPSAEPVDAGGAPAPSRRAAACAPGRGADPRRSTRAVRRSRATGARRSDDAPRSRRRRLPGRGRPRRGRGGAARPRGPVVSYADHQRRVERCLDDSLREPSSRRPSRRRRCST